MPALNWIDWLCLAVIGISLLLGLWRGLIYEVFALVGWIAAFFLAQHYATALQPTLAAHLPLQAWGPAAHYALAFVLLFILVLILSGLAAWGLKQLTSAVGLKPVDRFLGACFGLLRAALILLTLTALAHLTPLPQDQDWARAHSSAPLDRSLTQVKPLLPAKIQAYLQPAP
jgi:membrane protein required for colicin V production